MKESIKFIVIFLFVVVASCALDYSNCEMCHKPGGPARAAPWGLNASPHAGIGCTECHPAAKQTHSAGAPSLDCAVCHTDIVSVTEKRAHDFDKPGTAKCYNCHGHGHSVISAEKVMEHKDNEVSGNCSECHSEIVENYLASAHSGSVETLKKTPSCFDCHGGFHTLMKVADTPVLAHDNLPDFCGECHKGKKATSESPFNIPNPSVQLLKSVHGEINEKTGKMNAACYDCHFPHSDNPSWEPEVSTNFMNVAEMCGNCHREEYDLYSISVHGLAAAAGVNDSPTCIHCHGDHNVISIEEFDPAGEKRTRLVDTCSSCHFTLALASKYDIASDRVETFEESYHGVVAEGGKITAADCGSCHGVHDVLPHQDPRSSVHPANLETTCGECHEDAGERFANTKVHALGITIVEKDVRDIDPAGIVAVIYIALIVLVIGGMLVHNGLDYIGKIKAFRKNQATSAKFTRLTLIERLQHIILLSSFTLLAITGFSIKYPSADLFSWIVTLEGPFPIRVTLHKILGVILIVVSIFHIWYLLFTKKGRERLVSIFPKAKDVTDVYHSILHKIGLSKEPPEYEEFNYAEKAEYWALVWGNIVMGSTGIYMWFDPYVQGYFPYWLYEVLRAIHFYEAILAVLAIIVWHLYFVIFDPAVYPMSFAWFDGKITEETLKHEKPGFYDKLKGKDSGTGKKPGRNDKKN
ncbi:MAG: hypothetical protein GY771_01955 [bacterium]|nr:hypothetical protein [bacterium]